MPNPLIKKFAEETNRPEKEVEDLWDKAKDIAKKKFSEKDSTYYSYVTGILKNMLSLSSMEVSPDVGGYFLESTSKSKKKRKIKLKGAIRARKFGKRAKKDKSGKTYWDKKSLDAKKTYLKKHPDSNAQLSVAPPEKPKEKSALEPKEKKTPEDTAPEVSTPEKDPTVQAEHFNKLNPKERSLVKKAVQQGFGKMTHIVKEKKITFAKGLDALAKVKHSEKMSDEDKEHLKDMMTIVMGVTLSAAIAFMPLSNYSGALAQMYLDYLAHRRDNRKTLDDDAQDQEDPTVLDDHEVDLDDVSAKTVQNIGLDQADWLLDKGQDSVMKELNLR